METSIVQMSMFQSMSWQLYSIDPCWRGKIVFFMWSAKSCSFSHNRTARNFVCSECHQKYQEKNEMCLAFISLAISQFCNETTKREWIHWIYIEVVDITMGTFLTTISILQQAYCKIWFVFWKIQFEDWLTKKAKLAAEVLQC